MTVPDLDASPGTILRLGRHLFVTAQVSGTALHVATWSATWDRRPALWGLIALFVIVSIGNPLFAAVLRRRLGPDRSEDLRNVFNVCVHGAIGILADWCFASWLFVPFVVSLANIPPANRALGRSVAVLLAFDAIALATGARLADALLFSAIAMFVHVLIESYLALATNVLRERERALHELAATKSIAVTNARLASIGQIAAGVAHEINNPMCFVTANIEQLLADLRDGLFDAALVAEYRDTIVPETLEGIARVNSIVDDLRRFARAEPEEHVELDLSSELHAACRMARTQLASGSELRLAIEPGVRMVGMRRQLGQAALNLIVNALQALDKPGHVDVRLATRADGGIELEVRDSGVGMTDELKQRIFDPFFTTKAPGRGTGLGLSVVHGIVKAHDGTITVASAPGAGTTFAVTFPPRRGRSIALRTLAA